MNSSRYIKKIAPKDIEASAILNIKNEKSAILRCKKSVTSPSVNLSIIFPIAPPNINDKEYCFRLSVSFLINLNTLITIRMPINVRIFEITLLPISKKPNATPELKVKYKSMKGRNSYDAPSINARSAHCLVTVSYTHLTLPTIYSV